MTGILRHHFDIAGSETYDERVAIAKDLRSQGFSDNDIAKMLMSREPHGSKKIITADTVWRLLHQADRAEAEG